MGKLRRQRQKLHLAAKSKAEVQTTAEDVMDTSQPQPILLQPSENLFAGIDINFDNIKKNLDDIQSVKSFKSTKSDAGADKTLSKKDKLKLRRELLMKKIDTVNQMKIEAKRRKKRKNVSIIGDTNPLHDALPSLQSLLAEKSKTNDKKVQNSTKKKGIEKATKRKKQTVQSVQLFKKLMSDKNLKNDPFKKISERVTAVVNQAKAKTK